MKRLRIAITAGLLLAPCSLHAQAAANTKVLVCYSEHVEADHVEFADGALPFLRSLAKQDHFTLDTSESFQTLPAEKLKGYRLVIWLNDEPSTAESRAAFADYMEHGGGWLGFHSAGYNDETTQWPWFVKFLGGAVFDSNSWPPLPAELTLDDGAHPVVRGIPGRFVSPANEWYVWKPDPRANRRVKVLVSLAASNFPLGWKDTLVSADVPVVWTNTGYRMLYFNMGHGDKIFTSDVQNRLFANAIAWLLAGK